MGLVVGSIWAVDEMPKPTLAKPGTEPAGQENKIKGDSPKVDAGEKGKEAKKKSEPDKSTNQPPPLKLQGRRANFNGVDLGTYATLTADKEKVAFQVPQGYQMQFSNQRVIIGVAGEVDSTVTLDYQSTAFAPEFKPEVLKAVVAKRFANGQITAQFATGALGTNALCFHLRIPLGTDAWHAKMVFIPMKEGMLTLASVASPAKAQEIFDVTQQLVNSLQSTGPDGVIKFPEPQLSP